MIDIHKLSEQMIDVAERMSNMADAAEGKAPKRGGATRRWVILPAAGAGLYALIRSDFFSRQTKVLVDEAKTRANELPNDLMKAVQQTAQQPTVRHGSRQASGSSSSPRRSTRSGGSRRRTTSTRKSTAGR